jgi:hypothetical protein
VSCPRAEFEGGPWDGFRIPWSEFGPEFPLTLRFEEPIYDPPITADPAADMKGYLRQLGELRIVARRSFLYELDFLTGPDGPTEAAYRFAGVETVPHREPVAS